MTETSQPSIYLFELHRQLNAYEVKREILQAELDSALSSSSTDGLADKALEISCLSTFIATLKGVLNA